MKLNLKQYTNAIFEIASENNLLDDYLELSVAILNIFNENKDFESFLANYSVDVEQKKKLIELITLENKFYKNWLYILIESGKQKFIKEYINEFINMYNEKNNIIKGFAWTTELIDQSIIKKLEDTISKKLNKKIMIENRINRELIGGIKLEVGDDVWDNSIKNKLMQLLTTKEGDLSE